MKVKATKSDVGYLLSLGSASVMAVRQPDLYFVIELDGTPHKGYLKELKEIFATAQGVAVDIENIGQPVVVMGPGDTEPHALAPAPSPHQRQARALKTLREVEPEPGDELPVIDNPGQVVAEQGDWMTCVQVPSARFPYPDGFALIERSTKTQYGWSKMKDRAAESLASQK